MLSSNTILSLLKFSAVMYPVLILLFKIANHSLDNASNNEINIRHSENRIHRDAYSLLRYSMYGLILITLGVSILFVLFLLNIILIDIGVVINRICIFISTLLIATGSIGSIFIQSAIVVKYYDGSEVTVF